MFEKIKKTINGIRFEKPLILNITNDVTMDFVANGLLSIGASPVMSKSMVEIEDLVRHAKSVVINLGTLNKKFILLCKHTCKIANQYNIPILLDPVGSGASEYRTDTALSLLNEYHIEIIRGNADEIISLSGLSHPKNKGVDSITESHDALESGKILSDRYGTLVAISGKIDIILDKKLTDKLDRGSSLMSTVTGTGCLLTAVIAAFHAIEKNRFNAAKMAMLFYGICGEMAAASAEGPGSFRMQFLDALYLNPHGDLYEKK